MTENNQSSPPKQPLTPAQIDAEMAHADGVMGAAGHHVSDPAARKIMRQYLADELSIDEAIAKLKAT